MKPLNIWLGNVCRCLGWNGITVLIRWLQKKNDGVIQFDVAPNLSFTRPVVATINGKVLNHPRWFSILTATVNELGDKGFRGVNLVRELSIPAKFGRYEEEGYKFHRELGISIQRRASQICWTEIDRLAQKWGIPVSVKFSWRQNPKAQHPGKSGFLSSGAVK